MTDSARTPAAAPGHAALMDAIYRRQRRIYDATRKPYLLGRDLLIDRLDPPPGGTVLELCCGTGRNLDLIDRRHPGRRLYGLDVSAEMLRTARAKLGGRATLARGDACAFDAAALFGLARFDRVVLSYGLSMIPDWTGALAAAADVLAPDGEVHVVDFGNLERLPGWFRTGLRAWLARFHVTPRADLPVALARLADAPGWKMRSETLRRDYAQIGVLRAPAPRAAYSAA